MAEYPSYETGPSSVYDRSGGGDIYGMQNIGSTQSAAPSLPAVSDDAPSISDHLLNLYGAGAQTLAAVRRGVSAFQTDPEARKYYDSLADQANNDAREHFERMSPAGQDAATRWNKHWIHGALMGAEQQLPALVPAGVAELLGGPPAAAATFGAISVGQAADNWYSAIANKPSWELERNPEFKALKDAGFSDEDARSQFAHNHVNDAEQLLVGGLSGAAAGYLGPMAKLFGRGVLSKSTQGVLNKIASSALETGTVMGTQTGLMDTTQAYALGSLGLDAPSEEDILHESVGAGLSGAAFGAVTGIRRPGEPSRPPARAYRPDEIGRLGQYPDERGPPRPYGFGAYGEGFTRPGLQDYYGAYGSGFRDPSFTPPVMGRTTGVDPTPTRSPGQAATPEMDAAKQRYSQHIDEEPVSGQASSKPGTGRVYTKDITPQGVAGPFEITPKDVTGEYDITPQDVGPPPASNPVAEDQNLALEAMRGDYFRRTQHMVAPVMRATGKTYKDVRKMNERDLTAAYNDYYGGGGGKEPLTAGSEEPVPVAQPPVAKGTEAAAQQPPSPTAGAAASLPTGGDEGGNVTSPGDFAHVPEGFMPGLAEPAHTEDPAFTAQIAELEQKIKAAQEQLQARGQSLGAKAEAQAKPHEAEVISRAKLPVGGASVEDFTEAQRSRERIAAAQAEEAKASGRPEGKGKNWTPAEIRAREENNKVADKIVADNRLRRESKDWHSLGTSDQAGGRGSFVAMVSRLRGMVADADAAIKAGRLKRPQEFNIMPSGSKMPDHSPSVLAIEEARRFLKGLIRYKLPDGKQVEVVRDKEDIRAHLNRELALTGEHLSKEEREAYYRKILPERVSEAEERMAQEERGPRAGRIEYEEEKHQTAASEKEKGEPAAAPEFPVSQRELAAKDIERYIAPIPEYPGGKNVKKLNEWKNAVLEHPLAKRIIESPRAAYRQFKPSEYLPWSDKMFKFVGYLRNLRDEFERRHGELLAKEEAERAKAVEPKPKPVKEPKTTNVPLSKERRTGTVFDVSLDGQHVTSIRAFDRSLALKEARKRYGDRARVKPADVLEAKVAKVEPVDEDVEKIKAQIAALQEQLKGEEPTKVKSPTGIPFMITKSMKAELEKLGYSYQDIRNMTPAKAHEILQAKLNEPEPKTFGERFKAARDKLQAVKSKEPSLEEQMERVKKELAEAEARSKEALKPQEIVTRTSRGNDIAIKPKSATSIREALPTVSTNLFPPEFRDAAKVLLSRISEVAGDVPIYDLPDAEMAKTDAPIQAEGSYNIPKDHILLNTERHPDPSGRILFHEAFHAATTKGILADKELQQLLLGLYREATGRAAIGPPMEELRNSIEWLTTSMTDRNQYQIYKTKKIPQDFAKTMGVPAWRKKTIFEAALSIIRKALGFGPRDTGVIEAALALSERAMKRTEELRGAEPPEALHSLQSIRLDRMTNPEQLHDSEEKLGERARGISDRLPQAFKDAPTNMAYGMRAIIPKFLSGVTLARTYGKLFADHAGNIISDLIHLDGQRHHELVRLAGEDHPIVEASSIAAKKFRSYMGDFNKLLEMSDRYNIHADRIQPETEDDVEASMAGWQARSQRKDQESRWMEANKMYIDLSPELQKHYRELRDFYRDKLRAVADERIGIILDNMPLPARETPEAEIGKGLSPEEIARRNRAEVLDRINKKDLTDADEEHYNNLGILDDIKLAQSYRSGKDAYFPAYRNGSFVLTGRYVMPEGGHHIGFDGEKLRDDTREFDKREQAHDFAVSTDLHATPRIVRYAKDTGERLWTQLDREKAEARGTPEDNNILEKYQVRLQREHMEMHDTASKAKRAQALLHDDPNIEDVSGVLDQREEGHWGKINSNITQSLERRVNNRDDLSPAQKWGAIAAIRQNALMMQTTFQKHLMFKRNIAGAEYAHSDAVRDYSSSANRAIANTRMAPEINTAMRRLENADRANRSDPNKSYDSSAVFNEMQRRVYQRESDLQSSTPGWLNRLMALSYMHWLVGPRHTLMLQSHPYAYSAPQMAGRFGFKAYAAIHDMAKELGGDFAGAKTGWGSAINQARSYFEKDAEKEAALARTPDMTGQMIARITNADERRAAEELLTAGSYHSGFGDEFYGATGMKRVDAMTRQLSSAQDAQNRVVVGQACYKLARAAGDTHAEAMRYAQKIIEDTMGVRSSVNTASALHNPMFRSFMQFKQFPLRQINLMARNVYNGFKGEGPEVRREAWRAFAHQLLSGVSMAGVHGLPLGLLKPLGLLGMAMGVTPSPTQMDDKLRRGLADMIGAPAANTIMDGALAAIPHSPNLSNMFSYDLDVMFGEPRAADIRSYLWEQLGGAPASEMGDTYEGLQSVMHGDWAKGYEKLPLPRPFGDLVKSWGLAEDGLTNARGDNLTPASYADAAWRLLGFGTEAAERMYTGREALYEGMQDIKDAKAAVLSQVRAGNMSAALKWNNANPFNRLTPAQIQQARRGRLAETILGIKVTPQLRQQLQEYQQVYQ